MSISIAFVFTNNVITLMLVCFPRRQWLSSLQPTFWFPSWRICQDQQYVTVGDCSTDLKKMSKLSYSSHPIEAHLQPLCKKAPESSGLRRQMYIKAFLVNREWCTLSKWPNPYDRVWMQQKGKSATMVVNHNSNQGLQLYTLLHPALGRSLGLCQSISTVFRCLSQSASLCLSLTLSGCMFVFISLSLTLSWDSIRKQRSLSNFTLRKP